MIFLTSLTPSWPLTSSLFVCEYWFSYWSLWPSLVKIRCWEVCENDVLPERNKEAETSKKQDPARLCRQGKKANTKNIQLIVPMHFCFTRFFPEQHPRVSNRPLWFVFTEIEFNETDDKLYTGEHEHLLTIVKCRRLGLSMWSKNLRAAL